MDLSVIVVNYNTRELLEKCLFSIFEFIKDISFEIIVVDNASSDSSAEMVEIKFPQVRLIKNKRNLGFGKANNQAAGIAKGKCLFFLNSDAYLIDDSLPKLLEDFEKNPKTGVFGTLVLNADKTIQQSVGFFPNLLQIFYWMSFLDDMPFGLIFKPYHIDHDSFYRNERTVDWVTGAAMLVRRKLFEKIGGFDKNIFMYGEDFEICYRIKKAGFSIIFSPKSKIVHLGRGSVGQANTAAILGEYRGLVYFYKKYKSNLALFSLLFLLKIGAVARLFIFGIVLMRKELLKAYFRALLV